MESLQRCEPSLNRCDLLRRIVLYKVFDVHIAAADAYVNLTSRFNLNVDPSRSKSINALRLPQKQYFHIVAVWIVIDEIGKCPVNSVILARYVKTLTLFKLFILLDQFLELLLV